MVDVPRPPSAWGEGSFRLGIVSDGDSLLSRVGWVLGEPSFLCVRVVVCDLRRGDIGFLSTPLLRREWGGRSNVTVSESSLDKGSPGSLVLDFIRRRVRKDHRGGGDFRLHVTLTHKKHEETKETRVEMDDREWEFEVDDLTSDLMYWFLLT